MWEKSSKISAGIQALLVAAFLVFRVVWNEEVAIENSDIGMAHQQLQKPVQVPKIDSNQIIQVPKFLEEYIAFHNSQIPLDKSLIEPQSTNAKYLIWSCYSDGCGGVGDRIKGIVSAFWTAICSGRVFLIDWPRVAATNTKLESYLEPHRLQWQWQYQNLPSNNITVIGRRNQMHGYNSPILKDLQVPQRLSNHTWLSMMTNRWYQDEIPDQHWYGGRPRNSSWYANNSQCLQYFWNQEEVLRVPTNANDQTPQLLPHYEQDYYLFRTAFWTLFQFSEAVHRRTRELQYATQLLPSSSSSSSLSSNTASTKPIYIAMHIRAGGSLATFEDPARHPDEQDYPKFYQCAKRIQHGIWARQQQTCKQHPPKSNTSLLPIYVASDDERVKQLLRSMEKQEQHKQRKRTIFSRIFGPHSTNPSASTIRFPPNMTIYHIDKSHESNIINNIMKTDGELTVWAELNLLIQSTCLVTSSSGFSQLATWLHPDLALKLKSRSNGHRCVVHFEDCANTSHVQQAIDAVDDQSILCHDDG